MPNNPDHLSSVGGGRRHVSLNPFAALALYYMNFVSFVGRGLALMLNTAIRIEKLFLAGWGKMISKRYEIVTPGCIQEE